MRVDADPRIGELRQVGAAEHDRARRAQTGYDGRVPGRGRLVGERGRSGGGDLAGNVEKVLHRNRQAGERGGDHARFSHRVARVRLDPRAVGVAGQERPRALSPRRLDGREGLLHELAAGRRTGGKVGGKLQERSGSKHRGVLPVLCGAGSEHIGMRRPSTGGGKDGEW